MYKIIGADQKEYGPISAEQLRQWISEGRVNAHTKVQAEGTVVWKTVSELPEFASVLPVHPPPVPPITMGPPASVTRPNPLAIWSLVTGIISIILCCLWIIGPISIVLGCVALSQIKKKQQTGSGLAITGIILGVLSLIMAIILTLIFLSFPQFFQDFTNTLNL